MTTWLTQFIESFGYIAIILLIAVENIFPPIPSEVILTLGGFLVSGTKLTLIGVILASTLGSVIGAIILFSISRNLTLPRLEKLLETKLFKLLGSKKMMHKRRLTGSTNTELAQFFMVAVFQSLEV